MPKDKIILVPELYMANNDAFVKTIREAPQKSDAIAIFSHNNGITEFANRISEARIDDMPTCSVFAVKCHISDWSEFQPEKNDFYFFDFPKSV
jgi:phosphohistidine phosphatase